MPEDTFIILQIELICLKNVFVDIEKFFDSIPAFILHKDRFLFQVKV